MPARPAQAFWRLAHLDDASTKASSVAGSVSADGDRYERCALLPSRRAVVEARASEQQLEDEVTDGHGTARHAPWA